MQCQFMRTPTHPHTHTHTHPQNWKQGCLRALPHCIIPYARSLCASIVHRCSVVDRLTKSGKHSTMCAYVVDVCTSPRHESTPCNSCPVHDEFTCMTKQIAPCLYHAAPRLHASPQSHASPQGTKFIVLVAVPLLCLYAQSTFSCMLSHRRYARGIVLCATCRCV